MIVPSLRHVSALVFQSCKAAVSQVDCEQSQQPNSVEKKENIYQNIHQDLLHGILRHPGTE